MHATLIDDLGGSAAVAKALGIKNSDRVSNWKLRGVPWAWRPAVANLASANGAKLPDDFLSPPSPEAAA